MRRGCATTAACSNPHAPVQATPTMPGSAPVVLVMPSSTEA